MHVVPSVYDSITNAPDDARVLLKGLKMRWKTRMILNHTFKNTDEIVIKMKNIDKNITTHWWLCSKDFSIWCWKNEKSLSYKLIKQKSFPIITKKTEFDS